MCYLLRQRWYLNGKTVSQNIYVNFSQVEIGVTSDGQTIVCYHPSMDVPYELTQVMYSFGWHFYPTVNIFNQLLVWSRTTHVSMHTGKCKCSLRSEHLDNWYNIDMDQNIHFGDCLHSFVKNINPFPQPVPASQMFDILQKMTMSTVVAVFFSTPTINIS